jgi:uncharacterized repeat protein (TIGR04076 family)
MRDRIDGKGGGIMSGGEKKVAFSGRGATKVKITVLKTPNIWEGFKEEPIKARYSGPCPIFFEGQEFIVDAKQPKITLATTSTKGTGFCPYAWEALFPMGWKYYEEGANAEWYENDKVVISCCPDGVRPVIFKLEWT